MLRAVSATDLVKERPGFGQRVVPRPGSVLASPVPASYDPDPDYFFHWFRDSAIIIDALRVAQAEGLEKRIAVERLREFVDFSRSLRELDGRELVRDGRFRDKVQPSVPAICAARRRDRGGRSAMRCWLKPASIRMERSISPVGRAPRTMGRRLKSLRSRGGASAQPDLDDALQAAMLELVIGDLEFIRSRAKRAFVRHLGGGIRLSLLYAARASRGAGSRRRMACGSGRRRAGARCAVRQRTNSYRASDSFWSASDGYLPLKDWRRRRRPGKGSRHLGDSWRASRWAQGGNAQRA